MASELTAWMAMLALDGPARAWEPQTPAAAPVLFLCRRAPVRGGRRLRLRIAASCPWATQLTAAITRLQALAPADQPEPSLQPEGEPAGRGTPPTRRDSGATAHDRTLKISDQP